jgi:hypothetical protein
MHSSVAGHGRNTAQPLGVSTGILSANKSNAMSGGIIRPLRLLSKLLIILTKTLAASRVTQGLVTNPSVVCSTYQLKPPNT